MDGRHHLRPLKDKIFMGIRFLTFFLFCTNGNPHRPPPSWEWELRNTISGEILAKITAGGGESVRFSLELFMLLKGVDGFGYGSEIGQQILQVSGKYFCPCRPASPGESHTCLNEEKFFCSSWGCETISTIAGREKQGDPYLIVTWGTAYNLCIKTRKPCNPVNLEIRDPWESSLLTGKTWGIRIHNLSGWGWDDSVLFTIQGKAAPGHRNPIGPLSDLALPIPVRPPQAVPGPPKPNRVALPGNLSTSLSPSPGPSLLSLLEAVH